MSVFNDDIFIEAIKRSAHPKLAYNATKELYKDKQSFATVGQAVLDIAWADAAKFNKANERKKGRLRRPARIKLDEENIAKEIDRFTKSTNKTVELGRMLTELDEETLKIVYERIAYLLN